MEAGVTLRYVDSPQDLGRPDLIILPGTKTTIPDLDWMDRQGLTQAIREAHANGSALVGICGGYQMLGSEVRDPDGVESTQTQLPGLGLLPMTTTFAGSKETHRVTGKVSLDLGLLAGAKGLPVQGYEIHMGRTAVEGVGVPFAIDDRSDLAVTKDNALDGSLDSTGWVMGTYIHGLFHNTGLRQALLQALARRKGVTLPSSDDVITMDGEFDKLADWVRGSLNMDQIYQMSGLARDFDNAASGR
jgi:adenosylcobyric acid synthase